MVKIVRLMYKKNAWALYKVDTKLTQTSAHAYTHKVNIKVTHIHTYFNSFFW